MSQHIGKRQNIKSTLSYGLSKPSKQSLVARGLAANEAKARKRLQEQTQIPEMTQKPGYIFYNSSDSDQVYSMNKKLDRFSSLLQKIAKEDDKPSAARKANSHKKESKKVVKIVLPNAMTKPGVSGPNKGTAVQKGKMITSTPNLKKRSNAKKTKDEEELLRDLSRMEMEKSHLQEQYSKLLQQHLAATGSKLGSSLDNTHENFWAPVSKDNEAEPMVITENTSPSKPLRFESSKLQDTNSNLTSSSVFQELERKITDISEKLSFPRSQASNVNHGTTRTTDDFSRSSFGLSYENQDINAKYEAEKDHFIPRDSSHTLTNESREFLPIFPSVEPAVSHQPMQGLHSSVSLDETSYCSSLSDSEREKTVIADNVNSLHTDTIGSSESEGRKDDRHSSYIKKETSSIESSDREELCQLRTEPILKTVRFQHVPSHSIRESEDISSCDEGALYTKKVSPYREAYIPVKEASPTDLDNTVLKNKEEAFPRPTEKNEYSIIPLNVTPAQEMRKKRGKTRVNSGMIEKESEETKSQSENVGRNAKSEKTSLESAKMQKFYESPTRFGTKSSMDVVSQLSHMKEPGRSHLRKSPIVNSYMEGIKPGFAATQITALSYLFRELTKLLSDRISSEEDRLLTEIDHMIGIMPFLISNLNPDLQTEISLAVQPLRVENSDLRRQLRIANQKVRDYEANVRALELSLKEAENRAVGEVQLERLKAQINQDETERKMLKERIVEINKSIEELKGENQKLVQQIIDKDSEVLKQKQLWQKEKSSIYAEHDVAKKKLESMSLTLQAHEKQNRILQLSLSQSEAEIMRLKELNRELRDSVAKLLKDLNYKEPRKLEMQQKSNFDQRHRETAFKKSDVPQKSAQKLSNNLPPNMDQYGEINKKMAWYHGVGRDGPESISSLSEQNGDISSMSSVSDLTPRDESMSAAHSFIFSDQFSTLTCDSGEFRSNLADLSSKIRTMQESLHNAKRT